MMRTIKNKNYLKWLCSNTSEFTHFEKLSLVFGGILYDFESVGDREKINSYVLPMLLRRAKERINSRVERGRDLAIIEDVFVCRTRQMKGKDYVWEGCQFRAPGDEKTDKPLCVNEDDALNKVLRKIWKKEGATDE